MKCMSRRFRVSLTMGCLLSVGIMMPISSQGAGFGFFLGGARSSQDWEDESYSYTTVLGGFTLDSNVAADRVFNYRLELFYGSGDHDFQSSSDMVGMNHTFGFGVVRTRPVRVWLGPQIGLYYESGGDNRFSWDTYGFNIGPAVGVNFNMGPVVSLALTGYARFGGYYYDDDWGDNSDTERIMGMNLALYFRTRGDRYGGF